MRHVTAILAGRTGSGKSSLINRLAGAPLAETDAYEACTGRVRRYPIGTGRLTLVDTPGFAEDLPADDLDCLRRLRRLDRRSPGCRLLYVTRIDECRFRPDERRTLDLLLRLPARLWRRPLLVLTFADRLPAAERRQAGRIRRRQIEAYLRARSGGRFGAFEACLVTGRGSGRTDLGRLMRELGTPASVGRLWNTDSEMTYQPVDIPALNPAGLFPGWLCR